MLGRMRAQVPPRRCFPRSFNTSSIYKSTFPRLSLFPKTHFCPWPPSKAFSPLISRSSDGNKGNNTVRCGSQVPLIRVWRACRSFGRDSSRSLFLLLYVTLLVLRLLSLTIPPTQGLHSPAPRPPARPGQCSPSWNSTRKDSNPCRIVAGGGACGAGRPPQCTALGTSGLSSAGPSCPGRKSREPC